MTDEAAGSPARGCAIAVVLVWLVAGSIFVGWALVQIVRMVL